MKVLGTETDSKPLPWTAFVLGCAIGIGAGWFLFKSSTPVQPINPTDPNTVVVDPTDPSPQGINLKNCVLIYVTDQSIVDDNPKLLATEQDDIFWKDWAKGILKDVETVDKDEDAGKAFLSSIGSDVAPPLVGLYDTTKTSGNVYWVIPLPEGTTDPIRKKIEETN